MGNGKGHTHDDDEEVHRIERGLDHLNWSYYTRLQGYGQLTTIEQIRLVLNTVYPICVPRYSVCGVRVNDWN